MLAQGEILKVTINSEDDSLLTNAAPHNLLVRDFLTQVADLHHIMALLAEELGQSPPHVDIHDEFHPLASFDPMATGNTSSSATRRRA
jgi:hypothetical protein